MIIDIAKVSYEATWFDFQDGVRFKIRPYPASISEITFKIGGGMIVSGMESLKMFVHCLVEWEGIVGADERPLPCTEEVKHKIFDFHINDIPAFVLKKVRDFETQKEVSKKN